MDRSKNQADSILGPDSAPEGVIASPDTGRAQRMPPGQSRTKKWPVLDATGPPAIDMAQWKLRFLGMGKVAELSWAEFTAMPRARVFADFHCVTRWSRLGNLWEGVSTQDLVARVGGAPEGARFILAHGYDRGFSTNVPIEDFVAGDALVAILHDGEPISRDHGGPARLIVPRLYAWKSAKWLSGIEFLPENRPGYWERNGYHMRGDPWAEERHSW